MFIEKFIPETAKCYSGKKFISNPTSITIHWVGPYPTQTPDIVRDWWIESNGLASAHFIIKDDECMQCWPIDTIAWHCGSIGNYTSIGIEIIPENKEGKFSEKSIATLKKLLKTLPNLPLVRHYDWTGKLCPQYYCQDGTDRWIELLNKLK